MNFDFTGHADATLKDTVNLAVKQLEESDTPRLYFPCKRVGDEVNDLQYHYFGRYYEEDEIVTSRRGNIISAGATFSMKNLTEKPENWDETWGAFYIDEKDNTGFKIYIVVPHVGVTDYTISYIEYSIVNRVFKYTRNFKELKRSYKNIQEAFSEVSYALKIKNILFVLSPRATPMFYYDMYTTMATMNKEVASYIGRFLERLLQYSWIEVLYKSGLPRTTVKEYMSECKWCGKPLEGNKHNFCSKECADDYSWRVTERRTLPALPHRVALRDNFTCIYCGKDVASTNRHGMRLPVSSGDCSCDHLIPVARGGTDHISNLGCACKDCNFKKGVLTIDEFYVKLEEERLKEENK